MRLNAIIKTVEKSIRKNSPEILMGIGIFGFISTTIYAVKVTPKAVEKIKDKKEEKGEDLTNIEVVKETWEYYMPAIITGAISMACIICSGSINKKRNVAIATAYGISEMSFAKYKDKVIETIGKDKNKEIEEDIVKDDIKKNPPKNSEVIIVDDSEVLCYDSTLGGYFKTTMKKIEDSIATLNALLFDEMYVSVNEFYYELGRKPIEIGDELGWNIDDGRIQIDYFSVLSDDNKPCLAIRYSISPRYDYRKLL